jgi:16S rRNA (adenine1518-N6/adenine1519-N6)-dimethyltransferase
MPFDKRKAFGQHFLHDTSVIQPIVSQVMQAAVANPDATILEIGPGEGAITRPLLQALPIDRTFMLAERDRELIEFWKGESRVHTLIEGDFVKRAPEVIPGLGPLIVVSNLPYSAGTAIVLELCQHPSQISEMILMFQAEVAKRLYAEPSTPDRGSLTLAIQNQWDVSRLMTVKPQSFKPPPKVMSEVVVLKRRAEPRLRLEHPADQQKFEELVKKAFQHRRKMLRGNLSAAPWKAALERSQVDPTARAESLTWEQWIQIWNASQDLTK